MNGVAEFEWIIKKFRELPPHKEELPTFMEISGYPHYENVCSNILRFFFDSEQPHGLGDLLVQSLAQVIGADIGNDISHIKAEREVLTDKDNRIDLVIQSDQFVIGIENKVFATLTNDLADYTQKLSQIAGERVFYRVLLTLVKMPDHEGFINVMYEDLFQSIEANLKKYETDGHPKYIGMLKDFMESLRRMKKGFNMEQDLLEFLRSNHDAVMDLAQQVKGVRGEMRKRLENLSEVIVYSHPKVSRAFWPDPDSITDVLYFDIKLNDQARLVLDVILSINGWHIRFYWRRSPGLTSECWLKDKEINSVSVVNEPTRAEVWRSEDMDAPIAEIAAKVTDLLTKVVS